MDPPHTLQSQEKLTQKLSGCSVVPTKGAVIRPSSVRTWRHTCIHSKSLWIRQRMECQFIPSSLALVNAPTNAAIPVAPTRLLIPAPLRVIAEVSMGTIPRPRDQSALRTLPAKCLAGNGGPRHTLPLRHLLARAHALASPQMLTIYFLSSKGFLRHPHAPWPNHTP